MRRSQWSTGLLAVLASLSLVAAAGGGDDNDNNGQGATATSGAGGETQATGSAGERQPGGTLSYAADQEPTGFNGNTSKDNGTSVKNVIENLFYYASKATPDFKVDFPGLESAPTVVSQNPQVVEWKIKQNAAWSDGTPVTADDWRYFHEQTIKPENDVASRVGYDQIKSFESPDPKTVRVTFDPPYSEYEGLWIDVPQAKFMQAQPGGWNTGLDNEPGPSAGPYVFGEWRKGESLTLRRNDAWWGDPKPTLDSMVFRFLPESTTQPDALRNNEVDMIYPQPQLDLVQQVEELGNVKSETNFGPTFEHLTFNLKNQFLSDVAVRRAISKAVDRNALVEALMKPFSEDASRLDNRVYMTNQEQYKAHGAEYQEPNVDEARKLLEGAGFTRGGDGIYTKGGQRLSMRISTTAGNRLREQQGELIKAQLAQAGIELVINNSPNTNFFGQRLPNGDFDIANFAWVGSVFPINGIKQIYETGSDSNYGGYSDPRFDDLTRQAAAELDAGKRAELGNQIDEVLWEQIPSLPLYQKPTFLGIRDTFTGVGDNTTLEGPFWNSNTWGMKAQ